jgi:excisionase family DNA binding protein
MGTSYALRVSDEDASTDADGEVNTAQAAELLGVSQDTVRAMIRDGTLPARQKQLYSPARIKVSDVEKVRESRTLARRAGPADLTGDDRKEMRAMRQAVEDAEQAVTEAEDVRAALVIQFGHLKRATGAIAKALDVSRSTVQDILRPTDVPVVHWRHTTPLTEQEIEQLRKVQAGVVEARRRRDDVKADRVDLAERMRQFGGYGLVAEIAHELGLHRTRTARRRPARGRR